MPDLRQKIEELQQLSYDRGEAVSLALAGRRLGKKVLRVEGLSKSFDGQPLFDKVDFHLEPGDRVGIIGPNGTGKSTFLNILAGQVKPDSGQIDWGDTEASESDNTYTVFDAAAQVELTDSVSSERDADQEEDLIVVEDWAPRSDFAAG